MAKLSGDNTWLWKLAVVAGFTGHLNDLNECLKDKQSSVWLASQTKLDLLMCQLWAGSLIHDPLQLLCIFEYISNPQLVWYPTTGDAKWAVWFMVSECAGTPFKAVVVSKSLQCKFWYFSCGDYDGAYCQATCGIVNFYSSLSAKVHEHPLISSMLPEYFHTLLHEVYKIASMNMND